MIPDTIVAPASGHARAPYALLRLAGPEAHTIGAHLLDPAPAAPGASPCAFLLTDTLRVPAIALRADAPASYSADDTLELLLPGNPALIERALARLRDAGARDATPGEFTARAYLAGKLTLEQAEGVSALIGAASDEQREAAHELMAGRTGAAYRAWSNELLDLLALVEAGIDFTDQEDVVPIAPRELADRLGELADSVRAFLGARDGHERTDATPACALAGVPSAGKSTLFNALLGRTRSVTHVSPGTTRDAIEETIDLSACVPGASAGTVLLRLIDPAGIDAHADARSPIDEKARHAAHDAIANASIVVWCDPDGVFDGSLPGTRARRRTVLRVRTKADLPRPHHAGAMGVLAHEAPSTLDVCALDAWNLDALRTMLADAAFRATCPGAPGVLPRHRAALARALEALARALGAFDPDARTLAHPELVAEPLRDGAGALASLSGRLDPDEIIGRIFATFCVGK